MRDFPEARRVELDQLLALVTLFPGMTVLDLQAAGGFVADEVHRILAGQVQCLCIEPSAVLRARINPVHQAFADSVDHLQSIRDRSCDLVLGLAGLHHSALIARTLAEVYRVLRPDGVFAVCDIEAQSPIAKWLNEFVNVHSPQGHRGKFLSAQELQSALSATGFKGVEVARREVPWRFGDERAAQNFLRGLFGLRCDSAQLKIGMAEYLECATLPTGYTVGWSLLYARGIK